MRLVGIAALVSAAGACAWVGGCSASGSNGSGAGDASAGDGAVDAHADVAIEVGTSDGASDGGVTDASDSAVDTGPTCTLMNPTGTQVCDDCLSRYCCEPWNTCTNDTGCLDIFICTGNCVDAGDAGGCINDCESMRPGSVNAFNAMIQCLGAHCVNACQ